MIIMCLVVVEVAVSTEAKYGIVQFADGATAVSYKEDSYVETAPWLSSNEVGDSIKAKFCTF